mgnify:CR=1 FL=1
MLHYLDAKQLNSRPTRRTFLKLSTGALGGFMIGAVVPHRTSAQSTGADHGMVTPFVHITPDNRVIVGHGDGTVHAMRLVQQALDPRHILNPGKVVVPPPWD